MIDYALTLVGPNLTNPKIESLRANLAARGVKIEGSRWLSDGAAMDLMISLPGEGAEDLSKELVLDVRRALPRIDVAVVPIVGRRKRLLVADMDSTLVPTETIVEMAALAGVGEEVKRLTDQAMRGRLDFAEALIDRVKLIEGLDVGAVERLGQTQAFTPGAETLIATMRTHGARTVLVSGGFTAVTQHIAVRLGLDRHVANELVEIGGRLTGGLGLPIVDGEMKAQILEEERQEQGLETGHILAVGDGANDSAMIISAGLGVAYYGKPVLQKVADAAINHTDLRTLLYFQGYEDSEFIQP